MSITQWILLGSIILICLLGIDMGVNIINSQTLRVTIIDKSDHGGAYQVKLMSGEWYRVSANIYNEVDIGKTYVVVIEKYNYPVKSVIRVEK